ncbi:ribokinase [Komagataeibacter sp. FNDCF1]|uniref:ribokinase n=1 Tax=Komagataeibacter sp. FNDCF1 TaxID=2878681 RepID=UPI001E51C7CB|nr:ribokinase [Komagataeibacter sp. FNDCF1]MCE2565154.1 ribokinase [Komagataeibacter sp. FNDCF1]
MSTPSAHIAVIGSTNIDFVMHVTRFARPGETMHVLSSATGLGGKGANQAMAVARLGRAVALAGWTGRDMLATMARTTLEDAGVDTRWLLEDAATGTGRAFITINHAGENQILVDGGANMAHTHTSCPRILPALTGAGLVMMQMEMDPDLMLAVARHARAHAIPVMLDPAPVPAHGLPDALWALADILTPNEHETAALTGVMPVDETTALAAARILHGRGVGTAIIKLGHRGVVYSAPGAQGFVPPFRVHAIDTVAAGDCFNAGLATALVGGATPGQAVRLAAACGALATTRAGAAQAAPTMPEVKALLAQQPEA